MSDFKGKLQAITKEAIDGEVKETAEQEQEFARRLVDDIEKADHRKTANVLCEALKEEAEKTAQNGEKGVARRYVLYEIAHFNPTLLDIGYWTLLLSSTLFYGGLVAKGVYENTVVDEMFISAYRAKHKYIFNPLIYASGEKFGKLAELIIEELSPMLEELLPNGAEYEFEIEGLCLAVYLGLEW